MKLPTLSGKEVLSILLKEGFEVRGNVVLM